MLRSTKVALAVLDSILSRRSGLQGLAAPEDRLRDELLVDHHLEGRGELVLADALEAEAEDAVELTHRESDVERAEADLEMHGEQVSSRNVAYIGRVLTLIEGEGAMTCQNLAANT